MTSWHGPHVIEPQTKKRKGMTGLAADNTGGDAGNGGHEETSLDPMKNGWHVFRGPPDYTHVVLPWIYEQKLATIEHVRDFQFRMTSPYQPLVTPQSNDLNIGAGVADGVGTHPTQTRNNFDKTSRIGTTTLVSTTTTAFSAVATKSVWRTTRMRSSMCIQCW